MTALNKPVDVGFNVAVLHIADKLFPRGFDVRADMPFNGVDDFAKLKQIIADNDGRMVVWSGGSDATIFGDPEVNYAFRAWHDWCHLNGNYPFTVEGEAAAATTQAAHLIKLYGAEKSRPWRALLKAEVVGQAEYYAEHGQFPANQVGFDLEYLARECPEIAYDKPRVS